MKAINIMVEKIYSNRSIMLVSDEINFLERSTNLLESYGLHNIITCQRPTQYLDLIENKTIHLVILDDPLSEIPSSKILKTINKKFTHIPVIVLTEDRKIDTAVTCMKMGAFDYQTKPIDCKKFLSAVRTGILAQGSPPYTPYTNKETGNITTPDAFSKIITKNKKMTDIFTYIETISTTRRPVLIKGETGVGKEEIAHTIHKISNRPGKFVAVNISSLDDTVLSDTLFGHTKGAFTDAGNKRSGLLEEAADGTLFLDEIGDLQKTSQIKLLRLLQEAQYYKIGSDRSKTSNARIITATNRSLRSLISEGTFRQDLYYRLRVHEITIPPLRERTDDIALLVEHFLTRASKTLNIKKPTPPKELYTLLFNYNFPGNIRELENMVFDAVSRHKKGILSTEFFKKIIYGNTEKETLKPDLEPYRPNSINPLFKGSNFPTLKVSERIIISEALRRTKGNQTVAANMLGISRTTLNKKINKKLITDN